MVKAIDTIYNGYRFRSRLEARWAVFFDALEIPYEYEKEGYELGDGMRYLPDFWLPRQRAFVEIRPAEKFFHDAKCERLSYFTERMALYVAGEPWPQRYRVAAYGWLESGKHTVAGVGEQWRFALGRRDTRELWLMCEENGDTYGCICLNPITDDERWPLADCRQLQQAYATARQARFEHGETGA